MSVYRTTPTWIIAYLYAYRRYRVKGLEMNIEDCIDLYNTLVTYSYMYCSMNHGKIKGAVIGMKI